MTQLHATSQKNICLLLGQTSLRITDNFLFAAEVFMVANPPLFIKHIDFRQERGAVFAQFY